tara:strand:+ start:211 stop:888 length:678 start_codon:yes stop_codon:yes gene_type:complete
MGCSFSRPGQSGIDSVWSHYLEKKLQIPVENLTWASGGSNGQILRTISEYIWNHAPKNIGFIIQWTTIDRQEFCDEEEEWYTIRQMNTKDGKSLSENIKLKIDKIKESQAYTYSESTYFWQFLQQILSLDNIMRQNNLQYFQTYCIGTVLKDFLLQNKRIYFTRFHKQITKTIQKTNWFDNNILRADLSNKGFPTVSKDDPHFNSSGHKRISEIFGSFIEKEGWL